MPKNIRKTRNRFLESGSTDYERFSHYFFTQKGKEAHVKPKWRKS